MRARLPGTPGPESERPGAGEAWGAAAPRAAARSAQRGGAPVCPPPAVKRDEAQEPTDITRGDAGIVPRGREGEKRARLGGAALSAGPGQLFCTLQLLGSGRVWTRMRCNWVSSLICRQEGPVFILGPLHLKQRAENVPK